MEYQLVVLYLPILINSLEVILFLALLFWGRGLRALLLELLESPKEKRKEKQLEVKEQKLLEELENIRSQLDEGK
tara:strand:+ start:1507 stop:1731 length:225 start_codon:yes stop_codon:yes gene_type:complete